MSRGEVTEHIESWRATRGGGGEMTRSAARRGRGHAWVRSGPLVDVTADYWTPGDAATTRITSLSSEGFRSSRPPPVERVYTGRRRART